MQAITQHAFGGPEVLELVDVPKPAPLPTEVLVRVRAAGVNPVEAFIRSGAFPLLGQPPFILGWDLSGVVEEVVPGTSRFRVGDEVYGMPFFPRAASTYAEYVAAPSRQLARKPRNLSHEEAAALPLAALTAYQALVDTAALRAGQTVLVHGGGGGVGHLAIQIAKLLGARVVATASKSKAEFVRSLGADQVIDYAAVRFEEAVRDVDVVFELIGQGYAERSIQVLRPQGILVTAIERMNAALAGQVEAAGRRFAGVAVEPDHVALERITQWVEEGRLRPHVEQVFPLREAGRAHERVASGSTRGKLVLSI
jgi:NADPH:quinone reductase-like Zn-dependent oxidoreductase